MKCGSRDGRDDYSKPFARDNKTSVPMVSASAAKKDGKIYIALANVCLDKQQDIDVKLGGVRARSVTGRILTASRIDAYNDFDHPERVTTATFSKAKIKNGLLKVAMPAKSIVVLEVSE